MNFNKLLSTAINLGAMLLENGAETYRVENSVEHILRAYGVEKMSVFTVPNCIIVTITTPKGYSMTKIKRVYSRTINLDKIAELNSLCRYISKFSPDSKYIEEKINAINCRPQFNAYVQVFSYSLISFAFTLFFGGVLKDGICAIFLGAIVKTISYNMEKFETNIFFSTMFSGAIIATLSILAVKMNLGTNVDKIIIGIFMNLVPGVALTNSVRDIIAGDFISGQTKLTETILTAVAIGLGPGIAIYISRLF